MISPCYPLFAPFFLYLAPSRESKFKFRRSGVIGRQVRASGAFGSVFGANDNFLTQKSSQVNWKSKCISTRCSQRPNLTIKWIECFVHYTSYLCQNTYRQLSNSHELCSLLNKKFGFWLASGQSARSIWPAELADWPTFTVLYLRNLAFLYTSKVNCFAGITEITTKS